MKFQLKLCEAEEGQGTFKIESGACAVGRQNRADALADEKGTMARFVDVHGDLNKRGASGVTAGVMGLSSAKSLTHKVPGVSQS